MFLRNAPAILAACGFAMLLSGCHHHLSYHDRVWNGWCGEAHGGSVCDSGCGKGCGQKAACCGKSAGRPWPLLSKWNDYTFCANGCGDVYVGPWISDPADCCDPCDACYGCYTGPNACCHKKIFDPLLWIVRYRKKHCVGFAGDHGVPTSGCHFVECPYVYGCHPQLYASGCGKRGCGGKGCCGGGVVGDYVPQPADAERSPHQADEIPTPVVEARSPGRVAEHLEPDETTRLRR